MVAIIPLLCPIAIWLALVFFFTALFLAMAEARGRLGKVHRSPCNHCAFYTRDYRLKCTVHPTRAFSEGSINCCDFERETHRQSRKSLKWLLGDKFLR